VPQATEPGGLGRATLIPLVVYGGAKWECLSIWSCSGWGLPSFQCHHWNWCALTAPFHPYHGTACGPAAWRQATSGRGARRPGGLFSVALSLGLPPLDVIQHPALWSPDFPPLATRQALPCSKERSSDPLRPVVLVPRGVNPTESPRKTGGAIAVRMRALARTHT